MRALVVYESMFGNTQKIAEQVVRGLAESMPAQAVEVASADPVIDDDVVLLVVGGPTHAFGMSRPGTRRSAKEQGEVVSQGKGVREWLARLKVARSGVVGAAFDTRINSPFLPGGASKGAAKALRKHGVRLIAPPTGFAVTGTAGPLADGELDRAYRWAQTLAEYVTPPASERAGRGG